MEHLCKIFSASQISSSNMANIGTTITAFSGLTEQGESWIINSGASDHMTRCERLFLSYVPSPASYTVVAGVGTVGLTSLITLQGVLHIPKLLCNLKSFSTITDDLNCVVRCCESHAICLCFSGPNLGDEDWQC